MSLSKTALHIQSYTKVAILKIALFIITFLSCFGHQYIFAQQNLDKKNTEIAINHIAIDAFSNTLKVYCSVKNNTLKGLLNGQSKLNLNIKNGNTTSRDVVIKGIDELTENTFILNIKAPLADAVYRTEKRIFVLQYITKETVVETRKAVVLGSFIKTYDLRPYMFSNTLNIYTACFYIFLLISLTLILITPLYNKFNFKKLHIKKYINIKEDTPNIPLLDPFTYVPIEDSDEIVIMNEKIMLLSSWKRLNKLPESNAAKKHLAFFKERLQGTFFKPKTEQLKRMNHLWFKTIGVFSGWIIFSMFMNNDREFYSTLMAGIFDTKELQVSSVIASNLLLGIIFGCSYSIFSQLSAYLKTEIEIPLNNYIKSVFIRSLMISSAFFIYALINAYIIQNYIITCYIGALLITLSLLIPTNFKIIKKAHLFQSFFSGSLACLFYFVIIQIEPKTNSLNTMLPILIFLLATLIFGEIILQLFKKRFEISKAIKTIKTPKLSIKAKNKAKNALEKPNNEITFSSAKAVKNLKEQDFLVKNDLKIPSKEKELSS